MREKTSERALPKWILYLLIFIIIAGSASMLFFQKSTEQGAVAEISLDGKVIAEITLESEPDGILDIPELAAIDVTLEVKDKAIRFINSKCPDKVCQNEGFIRRDMETAVCLPKKVAVVITDDRAE